MLLKAKAIFMLTLATIKPILCIFVTMATRFHLG